MVRKTVEEVKKAGIEAVGFFIIGFPTETKKEIKETINFACSLNLDRANFTKATPLPGTALYDIWIKQYATNKKIDWKTFNYYQFYADWSECSSKEIDNLLSWAFLKFYLTKFRFIKVLFSLKRSQFILFFKRIIKIIFKTELYEHLFTKKESNFKFINSGIRKNKGL